MLIFLISFFLIDQAIALDWSSSGHGFHTTAETLARNQSTFLISAQGRELGHRLTGDGEREQIFVNKNPFTANSNATSSQQSNVQLTQIRTTVLWAHGLTSDWTIGALLPLTNTTTKIKDEATSAVQKNSDTQIGNVEIVSKEGIFHSQNSKFSLTQSLRFPSARANQDELGVLPSPEPNGFAIGAGAIYGAYYRSRLSSAFAANYELNLPDKVQLGNQASTSDLSRDPGDVLTVGLYSQYKAIDEANVILNLIHSQKTRDKFNDETDLFKEESSRQSGAEVGLKLETHDESYFTRNYAVQLKYYSTLAGRNVQDEDSLSLQMQVIY